MEASLVENGYVLLPNCVHPDLRGQALRAINAELGRGLTEEAAAAMRVNAQSFGSLELLQSPAITDLLFKSGLWETCSRLYGPHVSFLPSYFVQVALRFPEAIGAQPKPRPWHVDNVTAHGLKTFGILVGVFLSDAIKCNSGQLVVFPGGHLEVQNAFRSLGHTAIHRSITGRIVTPSLSAEGRQLEVTAGDALIAHPLLPHSIAVNVSPNIRYAVYFRVYNRFLQYEHNPQCPTRLLGLQNIWSSGWIGVREALTASQQWGGEGAPPVICVDPSSSCECDDGVTAMVMAAARALSEGPSYLFASEEEVCRGGQGVEEDSEPESGDAALFWVRLSFCSGSVSFWRQARRFIAEELVSAKTVLDIGCASGFLLYCLQRWSGNFFTPYGIDKHWVVKFAPKLFGDGCSSANFLQVTLEEFITEGTFGGMAFDVIYFNVWDNYEVDERLVRDIKFIVRRVAPRGRLILGFYSGNIRNQEKLVRLKGLIDADAASARLKTRVVGNNATEFNQTILIIEEDATR